MSRWQEHAVDSAGSAYVTGTTSSANFPTFQPLQVALAAATTHSSSLNAGERHSFTAHIWRSSIDYGESIAIDNSGYAYVGGYTASRPSSVNADQLAIGGGYDAFVARLNPWQRDRYRPWRIRR
jgi:hypothetical protein